MTTVPLLFSILLELAIHEALAAREAGGGCSNSRRGQECESVADLHSATDMSECFATSQTPPSF